MYFMTPFIIPTKTVYKKFIICNFCCKLYAHFGAVLNAQNVLRNSSTNVKKGPIYAPIPPIKYDDWNAVALVSELSEKK